MEWQEIYGNWVVVPARPRAIVHFLGGAFVATAPQVTYRSLLEFLANQGYAVVATPFVNTLDHTMIAQRVMRLSNLALDYVQENMIQSRALPIYGIGHSMGCKLHLLIGSLFPQERAGNILISFNNYPARRAIPMLEQVNQVSRLTSEFASQFASQFGSQFPSQFIPQMAAPNFEIEFTPSPEETLKIILEKYQVRRNLLIKFTNDEIDQTRSLSEVVEQCFPELTSVKLLKGNHLTPLGQDVTWQPGAEFSPLDALGQFMKQGLSRDINELKQVIFMWIDPLSSMRG
jgi:hypothetical protein